MTPRIEEKTILTPRIEAKTNRFQIDKLEERIAPGLVIGACIVIKLDLCCNPCCHPCCT